MFWNFQRTLILNIYKTIDLYKFARLCQFIDQTLRDVNIKFRNINRDEYEKSVLKRNFSNQESNREQSNALDFKFRFKTFKSNSNNQKSNNCEMSQVFAFDQINAFICYNCDKSNHIARRCSAFKKMNSNNFVKEIEKNTSDQDNELRKE
jgi:hypothetical protein